MEKDNELLGVDTYLSNGDFQTNQDGNLDNLEQALVHKIRTIIGL